MAKYAQSTQYNKFAKSLQYLKKERRDEVDYLHTSKHQNFRTSYYQFWLALPVMPKVPRIIGLQNLCGIPKIVRFVD